MNEDSHTHLNIVNNSVDIVCDDSSEMDLVDQLVVSHDKVTSYLQPIDLLDTS